VDGKITCPPRNGAVASRARPVSRLLFVPYTPGSPTLREIPSTARIAAVALVVGAFVALFGVFGYLTAYGPHLTFAQSWVRLSSYEEWNHCFLVPVIEIWLVWRIWDKLVSTPIRPSIWGIGPLFCGFALFWISYRLDDIYSAFASFQFLMAGVILFLAGWRWMSLLFFPWLFLAFGWPLFFLDDQVAFPLRLVMSNLSTSILNVLGLAAVQVGTSIQSASNPLCGLATGQRFQLDVGQPCSGMHSLFALAMISALYGYIVMDVWWKRLILFFGAIPLAIIGNLARILMLTVGVMVLGSPVAIGTDENPSTFHMFCGYFVFIVALGGMLGLGAILNFHPRTWIDKWKALKRLAMPSERTSSGADKQPVLKHEDIY